MKQDELTPEKRCKLGKSPMGLPLGCMDKGFCVSCQHWVSDKEAQLIKSQRLDRPDIVTSEMLMAIVKGAKAEERERIYDMETGREVRASDKDNIWIRFPVRDWQALKEEKVNG